MTIKDILATVAHRPWPLPQGMYKYYQEWNELLFLHFRVEENIIRTLLPPGIQPDLFDHSAWVSLVPFTMNRIRPRMAPSWKPLSDFHEVNLRTYVTDGRQSGIYFFSLEAARWLPATLANRISGMPYEPATINRSFGDIHRYAISNPRKDTTANILYKPGVDITGKTPLERWLTERYCVYLDLAEHLYRYQVHHISWPLQTVTLQEAHIRYRVGTQLLTEKDIASAQYSPGVQVLAWGRERLL